MSKRELIARESEEASIEAAMPMLAAESALNKDWLTPEEDAAWAMVLT
jgi:hypothetical protein